MDMSFAKSHWAALIAAGLFGLVAIVLLLQAFRRTRSWQLRSLNAECRRCQVRLESARLASRKAKKRLDKLTGRAESSRPRHLREADEAFQDAQMLQKIAEDKLQIAKNHVRRLIYEEFPPSKHAKLRNKYLQENASDGRPFTF